MTTPDTSNESKTIEHFYANVHFVERDGFVRPMYPDIEEPTIEAVTSFVIDSGVPGLAWFTLRKRGLIPIDEDNPIDFGVQKVGETQFVIDVDQDAGFVVASLSEVKEAGVLTAYMAGWLGRIAQKRSVGTIAQLQEGRKHNSWPDLFEVNGLL
jgi:hypothetical protein